MPGRRALRIALVAGSVTLVLAVSSAVLVIVRLMDHGGGSGGRTTRSAAPLSAPESPFPCHVRRVDGRWHAVNSRTRQEILAVGSAGPDVAEAQCLLRRAGISPGGVDGIFGPLTEHAVKEFQQRAGLVVAAWSGRAPGRFCEDEATGCRVAGLRAATGLSVAALAAKTPYSKSSWERYLNGRTLPPREAVEELCRLAGEPTGRCLALWELAEAETSGRAAAAPQIGRAHV